MMYHQVLYSVSLLLDKFSLIFCTVAKTILINVPEKNFPHFCFITQSLLRKTFSVNLPLMWVAPIMSLKVEGPNLLHFAELRIWRK